QGYHGPAGWQACVLVPLEYAFRTDEPTDTSDEDWDMQRLAGAVHNTVIFDDELRAVPLQARRIQRDLERSVWNGRVAHGRAQGGVSVPPAAQAAGQNGLAGSTSFASALLREIAGTGERIKGVFE